jgi:hypothetical protein
MNLPDDHLRHVTVVADAISAAAIVGSFMKVLPPIAALAATLWYIVQIWESHTVQKWWRLRRLNRKTVKRKHRHGLTKRARGVIAGIGSVASDLGA